MFSITNFSFVNHDRAVQNHTQTKYESTTYVTRLYIYENCTDHKETISRPRTLDNDEPLPNFILDISYDICIGLDVASNGLDFGCIISRMAGFMRR